MTTDDLLTFLKTLKQHHIPLYHLEFQGNEAYTFFCPHAYTHDLLAQFAQLNRIGSTGLTFFLLSFIRRKYRLFGWGIACLIFMMANQFCWQVRIEGSRDQVTESLKTQLAQYDIRPLALLKENTELESIQNQLLLDFNEEIDWMNLYLDGHTYQIVYTPKVKEEVEKPEYGLLIASDDAIVDRIDVAKGNVLVKKNQHVKKGEVLVSNEITSTDEKTKLIETKGKIYGYTYKIYEASGKATDQAEDFVRLHAKILAEVQKEIGIDGHVDQENVLQYEVKEGKIYLKVQFTLYKNIAQKESLNE